MGTLVPRYMGLASCRIAELHRRRRQLRHAVAAGVNEAHECLPVYSFPLSWTFYCNLGSSLNKRLPNRYHYLSTFVRHPVPSFPFISTSSFFPSCAAVEQEPAPAPVPFGILSRRSRAALEPERPPSDRIGSRTDWVPQPVPVQHD